jgi:hypothetical protein
MLVLNILRKILDYCFHKKAVIICDPMRFKFTAMKKINLLFALKAFMMCLILTMTVELKSQTTSVKVFEDWTTTSGTQNNFQKTIVRAKAIGGITYYFTCGSTINSSGNYDILTTKLTAGGLLIWSQTYSGAGAGNDYGADIQIDNSGNVYVCGSYYNNPTDSSNAILIKYNSFGVLDWTRTYNGSGSRNDIFLGLQVESNVVVAVGSTWVNNTNKFDLLAIRYDASGNQAWTSVWDYVNLNDGASNVWISGNSLFVAGGAQSTITNYRYAVLRLKGSDGSILSSSVTGGSAFGIDQITDIQLDVNGNTYVTGGV